MTNDCKTCPVSTGTHKPAEAAHQIEEPQDQALLELAAYRFTVENREARIAELEAELEAIGAGGVEPLRKPVAAPQEEAIAEIVSASHDQAEFGERAINFLRDFQHLEYGTKLYPAPQAVQAAVPKWIDDPHDIEQGQMLNPEWVKLQQSDAPAHPAEGVPAQAEPFMWAIQEPGGSAYMDENCVSTSRGIVEAEVDGLNLGLDADDEPYKVVPVYLAATQPAAQGMDGREFPPLTPELASILGLMCFQCISFAQALRAAGHTIKTRAEDEQAAVLHWMLGHYFRHGDDWRTAAAEDMKRMEAEALAAQAKQGGA
jgi:hypothetical protein